MIPGLNYIVTASKLLKIQSAINVPEYTPEGLFFVNSLNITAYFAFFKLKKMFITKQFVFSIKMTSLFYRIG